MLSGRSFRAQLETPGQRELYDYWHQSAGRRRMPSRSDLDPFSVPKLLPCIGLIDVIAGLSEASFRLAGTRLRDIYGEEITGKRIDRVFAGACADYWRRAHQRVVEQGIPMSGVVRGPAEGRDHILLFWMRLPLSQDGCHVDRILCYDTADVSEPALASANYPWRPYPPLQKRAQPCQRRAHCG
jgi:hypothetical protein